VEEQIRALAETEKLHPRLLANFVYDPESPWPQVAGIEDYLDEATRKPAEALRAEIELLAGQIKPYDQVISITDQSAPTDLPVHPRGNTYGPSGDAVPRGVPRLLAGALPRPPIPSEHSGRL